MRINAAGGRSAAAAIVNNFLRPSESHRSRREADYLRGGTQVASLDPSVGVAAALNRQSPQPVQMAQASSDMPGHVPIDTQNGPRLDLLFKAAGNEFMPNGQQGIIEALIGRQMERNDPMNQMQLEKGRLELEALRNPQAKQTDDIIEWEAARSQGYPGTLQDWITEGRKAGATSVNVSNGGGRYGTIPQGFELIEGPEGASMRPIPGGPEDTSKRDSLAQGQSDVATRVVTSAAQRAREAAKQRNFGHVGQGVAANMPWTDSAEVARQVEVLKSTAKVENLTAMRQASPTGGALGSVTEKEADMLAAKSGAIDPSSPNFERDIDDYELTLLQVVHGPQEGLRIFSETRGGSGQPTPQGAPGGGNPYKDKYGLD